MEVLLQVLRGLQVLTPHLVLPKSDLMLSKGTPILFTPITRRHHNLSLECIRILRISLRSFPTHPGGICSLGKHLNTVSLHHTTAFVLEMAYALGEEFVPLRRERLLASLPTWVAVIYQDPPDVPKSGSIS
jgi:hypothetical protein